MPLSYGTKTLCRTYNLFFNFNKYKQWLNKIKNNIEIEFIDTFKDINFYLKKFKINAWMDAGLLLKYSRGQDLFPSSDIDFGVKPEDIRKIRLLAKSMQKKGYLVTTTGNTSVIFEGINIIKKIEEDNFITADIHIYYPVENYFCRPNSHKPLKQSYISRNLYRIFNKLNIILDSKLIKKLYVINRIYNFIFIIYSKLYFQITVTSQFAVPKKLLESFKNIKIYDEIVSVPKNNIKYIEWRYGSDWKLPNRNWRLTDGNMVILDNLKNYWSFFYSAPNLIKSKLFVKKYNNKKRSHSKKQSIFLFNNEELKIIKKSKIKSELYKINKSKLK